MALQPEVCPVCGKYGCISCQERLDCIREAGYQRPDEFRQIKKFREQVRNASRKDKRYLRSL
jgi:hypothetical protein